MKQKIMIQGSFPSLNDYIRACRTNHYAGAEMKKQAEENIRKQLTGQVERPFNTPVFISYRFLCPDKRRDKSNIASMFIKIFEDALVKEGLLYDDGWDYISGYSNSFEICKECPGVCITITCPEGVSSI